MLETDIMRLIQVAASKVGMRLFRNNVGQAKTEDGQFIRFGLCPGSSDLIGFKTKTITPEMVGKQIAVFTALEVKTERGRVTAEQQNFINMVQNAGGYAFVCRSESEFLERHQWMDQSISKD